MTLAISTQVNELPEVVADPEGNASSLSLLSTHVSQAGLVQNANHAYLTVDVIVTGGAIETNVVAQQGLEPTIKLSIQWGEVPLIVSNQQGYLNFPSMNI